MQTPTDVLDFDAAFALDGHECSRPPHVMPLWQFPKWKQDEIAEAVASPAPPPRWFDLGLAQVTSRAWCEWYWQRGRDPYKQREPLPAGIRSFVMERDEMVCGLCGYFVPEDDVHIDHILPVALGGHDAADNLQVAHSRCNMRKGARV